MFLHWMSTQRHCQRTSVSGPWAFPCHKREVTGKLLYPGLRDIVLSQRRTLHDRYKHVVVELGEEEAKASGWRVGYYLIDLIPKQAMQRLGESRKP